MKVRTIGELNKSSLIAAMTMVVVMVVCVCVGGGVKCRNCQRTKYNTRVYPKVSGLSR
jgi:hypothetical protein